MLEIHRAELIPPIVTTVGGFIVQSSVASPVSSPIAFSNSFADDRSTGTGSKASMLSDASSSSPSTRVYSSRGRQGSCMSTSTGGSIRECTPADNDALRELCEAHPRSSEDRFRVRNMSLLPWDIEGRNQALFSREERRRIKQEFRDKAAALKIQERALNSAACPRTECPTRDAERSLSLVDIFNEGPSPQASVPTRESIRLERQALKDHARLLKEQEKARKEFEKLEKLKAAVAARNEKIDAHDRAQREKQLQKEASKKAKVESWNARARNSVEKLWGASSFDLASKAQVARTSTTNSPCEAIQCHEIYV